MSSKRVVVLGASGFIGSHVVSQAEARGLEVVGLSSRDLDLMAPESIGILTSVLRAGDTVVHSAAIAPARDAAEAAANLTMTNSLVKAAEGLELGQLVIVSSDAVYGSTSGVVTEETVCTPDSFHGVMSLGRELACAGIRTDVFTIVRPAPVYGMGDPHNSYGPNRFARQALGDGQIAVFGGGEAGRDHVVISDVADVIVRSITQSEIGVINVASGQMRTFAEVAELVCSVAPSGATVASVGSEANPTFRSFDLSGLIRRFPNRIPTTPEIGIPAMLRLMVSAG